MTKILDKVRDIASSEGHATDYLAGTDDIGRYDSAGSALADKMSTLVKGAGYTRGGNRPLTDEEEIFRRAMRAEKAWKSAINEGCANPAGVYKSLSPEFAQRFGAFAVASPHSTAMATWAGALQDQISAAIGKNISLTSPLSTGLVPFNLVAPSRLIYPVYSPMRNKIARTQGMGASYRAKVITGVSGSQTGASGGGFVDIAIPEFTSGGSFSSWPLNLPGAGTQDSVDINVPYRFMGLSESVTWLAQMAGQGFEDVSALANLILMQEMMLNEEAMFLGGTSIALTAPSNPTLTARSANSGETAMSGITTNVFVKVAAANWYGETAVQSSGASVAWSSGQVVDVQIAPVAGALWYNVYATTGSSAGTYHRIATQVGGLNYTLQGALPTTTATPQSTDSGTSTAYRIEGIIPTLSGHSAGSSAVYPASWQGGYINQSVGDTLKTSVINTALQQLYNGSGAYRAEPDELIAEGGDLMRLSGDIVNSGANTNYRLFVEQSEVPGVRLGAAVSEFQHPITRKIVKVVVHPWLPQGTATLMSYQLPNSWSNVTNVWEFSAVQDYLSISWPVIDATFRYSMYTYGALGCNGPQYNALLQGLQVTDRSGSTGTWS